MGYLDEPRGPRRTEKKQYCMRCEMRQTFLFDHGEGMFLCTGCELD